MSKDKRKMKCVHCGRNKVYTSFIRTKDVKYFKDGFFPICKICSNNIAKEDGEEGIKFLLRLINVPFVEEVWLSAKDTASPFGNYVKQLMTLLQYQKYYDMPYQEILTKETRNKRQREKMLADGDIDTIELADGSVIEYDDTLRIKYGYNFTKLELLKMEKFFQDNLLIFPVDTPQKEESLITLAKLNLMLSKEFENGDVQNIKRLSDTIQKIAKDNGFLNSREDGDESYLGFTSVGEIGDFIERFGFIGKYPVIQNADEIDKAIEIAAAYYSSLFAEENENLDWYYDEARLKWIKKYVDERFELLKDKIEDEDKDKEIVLDVEWEGVNGDDDEQK